MGFWAWFDFFSQLLALGQPLNHSLFLHQEMNPQVMGTTVLQTPGPGASQRRCSLRKSEGPGVQATAMMYRGDHTGHTWAHFSSTFHSPSLSIGPPLDRNPQDELGNW